jgi:hypothetical protein
VEAGGWKHQFEFKLDRAFWMEKVVESRCAVAKVLIEFEVLMVSSGGSLRFCLVVQLEESFLQRKARPCQTTDGSD